MHITPTLSDTALFFKLTTGFLSGLFTTYVDETLSAGAKTFDNESLCTEQKFESKEREYSNFKFPGVEIEKGEDGSYFIHHK